MENYDAWQQHSFRASAGLRRRTSASTTSNKRESDYDTEDEMKIPATKRPLEEPDSMDDELVQKRKTARSGDNQGDTPSVAAEPWTEETHRQFVNAIYEVGLAHASPSVIMENMTKSHQAVTSERIKSHLQKYRKNKSKSTDEFLTEYESWLQKALTVGAASGPDSNLSSPSSLIKMMGTYELLGGELAGFLTYAAIAEAQLDRKSASREQDPLLSSFTSLMLPPANLANELAKCEVGAKIPFPVLTDEERKTHLGTSISHLVGLFYSMTNFIMKSREEKIKEEEEQEDESTPPLKKMQSLSSQWVGANAADQPEKHHNETIPRNRNGAAYTRGGAGNAYGHAIPQQFQFGGGRRDMSHHSGNAGLQHGFQQYNSDRYVTNCYPMEHFADGEPPAGPRGSDANHHHSHQQQRDKRYR